MAYQKVFKSNFIAQLVKGLETNNDSIIKLYEKEIFPITEEDCLIDIRVTVPDEIKLVIPDKKNLYSFENAKIVFNLFKSLPLIKASDPGLWTYLTHFTFWKYMKKRWPIEEQSNEKKGSFILEHWFVKNVGAADLARNGISSLWWGSYLTYDESKEDPYELTEQLLSMLDFYRTLIGGVQGRNKEFTHAILEFIIENKDLFKDKKETKVRLIMRRANAIGGYKLFTSLSKNQIKNIFSEFITELSNVA
ncbi:hypothetical protein COY15_05135 [Candidatus Roizmanbacteria bacterium CG_4_10_14_0_2_um_filter_39_12]|nr:MAG: hypothetical protein COY15_05135 [Candidatus Roizmanbacteria bacterium CG_4_10_14_0_2_um_filter_39_12]